MAKSVDLIYVGPHGAVNVPMPLGGHVETGWNQVFTTTEEHATALLQQHNNWKRAPKAAAKEKESD